MHDFDTQVAWVCESARSWAAKVEGSKGTKYTVRFGFLPKGVVHYGYECTCQSYMFDNRRPGAKSCKHIKAVEFDRCGWNEELSVGCEPDRTKTGEPCCPHCRGPVFSLHVGV